MAEMIVSGLSYWLTSLTLSGCLFSQCRAAIDGGVISVSPSHSFSITDTSG
jgi:hypothetical protein